MNWIELYKKYAGLWVAMKDDEITVISSAKTAKSALKKAQRKGYQNPILSHIPKELILLT
jgi:hypothetical protein